MLFTCHVCNRELSTTALDMHREALRIKKSYAAVLKIDNDTFYACADCVSEHDGPGKFEGNRDSRAELGRALILYALVGEDFADDYMSNDGWGYCGRFGTYLLYEDTSGFVTFDSYSDAVAADKEFQRLYLEGWGSSEFDAYVSDHRNGYSVSFEGKHIGTVSRLTRARAMIRLESIRTGYYPDAWYVNDHGNIQHIGY